ncbi:MAG: hypothetical protein OSA89_20325 [Mariniblastus sp.]|nr:hypothetical protein [Mariniblastus sp.]
MEHSHSPVRVSGAFLILLFCSLAGITASFVYSGYLAIILGIIAIALAMGTKSPESKRDRTIIFSLAGISVLLGVGAIAIGIVSRALAQLV